MTKPETLARRREKDKLRGQKERQRITRADLPRNRGNFLCTEEVAAILGTTTQYVKQMRTLKMGPPYLHRMKPTMTGLGLRTIVYRRTDLRLWRDQLEVFEGPKGRKWRFTPEGMENLKQFQLNKTHCPHGHEYTPENTGYKLVHGGKWRYRFCRECKRAERRGEEYNAKRRVRRRAKKERIGRWV